MDELWKEVSRPAWWFSVIFVGLLVSALGGHVRDGSDRLLAFLFDRVRANVVRQRQTYIELVQVLSADPASMAYLQFLEMRLRNRCILLGIAGMAYLTMSTVALSSNDGRPVEKTEIQVAFLLYSLLGLVLCLLAQITNDRAMKLRRLISEALAQTANPRITALRKVPRR